jgi:hypothetical protein
VAVAVPVLVLLVVNVVVPHPLAAALNDPPNLNVGSRSAMVSGVDVSRGTFSARVYVMDDGPCMTGFDIFNTLCINADVGYDTAVDAAIAVLETSMSLACARVTPTLRVLRFAV